MNDNQFNIRQLIGEALRYWYVFAIAFPLILAAARFYLASTEPKYRSNALILIKDDEKSGQVNEEVLFEELGLGKKMKTIQNEIYILRSTPIMEQVVKNLSLQNQYFTKKGLRNLDLYLESPIQILDWKPKRQNAYFSGILKTSWQNTFTIEVNEKDYSGEFGKEISLPSGQLTIAQTNSKTEEGEIKILISPIKKRAKGILANLQVALANKESSSIRLALKDEHPERAHDILMELISCYNKNSIKEQTKVYANTIDLINERIRMIAEELSEAESSVEAYKSRFSMVELSAEGSMLMNEIAANTKEISGKDVQLDILNSIEKFLVDNKENFEFVPTNISITNLTLTNQLSRFNQLLGESAKMRNDLGPSHPDLKLMEKQIQNLRQTIIDNIQSIKRDLEIASLASKQRKFNLESRLRSLPKRERELIEIERQKNVKENLYLYLLQKREESAISLAVTVANSKIIEPASLSSKPVSPQKAQIWLIALFMGIAIPAGIALLLENMNDKINFQEELEKYSSVPVLGSLPFSYKESNLIIKENSRSVASEMFRLLRTNLTYINPGTPLKTVLVTSSMSGEGKSFIALNLGMTVALTGKKVLVLELDLRKPKQNRYLGMDSDYRGVVNYLVDHKVTSKAIIRNSGIHDNLDIITRGPKPPNPGELILSNRLRKLMESLEQKYDFIILDTPPIGLVADALQLKDLPQAIFYIVRAGITRRGQLGILEDIAVNNKMPNPFIILNGVRFKGIQNYGKLYAYGYSYGNGYGYGLENENGYYEDDAPQNPWWDIFHIFPQKIEEKKGAESNGKDTKKKAAIEL